MYKLLLFFFVAEWCSLSVSASYEYHPENVTIVRDTFGVPHIYGKTDADAAYGLAWAHCEDAFELIQQNLLPAKKFV
jgi:acyl-homoserine-lactone acylase